ncbi:biotin/lipoyl-binding protein [Pseudomonas fluorescens]|uniref:HlyD family efflux transporter periplasmic adaptor subunit n=1 Tax=Pseudomonas fluorescens TaxID=294 RepID=UPI0021CFBBEE|nr:HlyD family efflux transporter periplasmic adaptor subunit [Pseudomonas fluorescens]UXV22543.1 biotin/lipoyl-binding protein [Pseudomonas fluorescens]
MDTPRRLRHEVQFLPAALALQEQPVHPAPRYILFSIMLFAALAFFWACLGEIDVVATATGKVVASGKSKTIQPSEVAVVKAIHVYDGEQVKVGDVLIELDASVTGADVRRLNSDLMAAKVDSTRAGAMLEAIQNHKEPGSLQGKINDAGPVQQTLPVSRRLAEDYKTLLEQQYVPRHAYLEKELALLDLERELALQRGRVNELKAAKKEAEGRWVGILAQTRRAMLDLQQQSEQKVASLTQEVSKAEQRDHLMRLTAPVDGMVQQLAVHTIGGVVTAAQPLMVVVPTDRPVEVEAMLENEVISVSNDAIEDEKRGLLYSVRVRLFSDFVTVKGKDISLVSGMSVSSNVKTDHRRIIDYLLSPLERHIAESMMEY